MRHFDISTMYRPFTLISRRGIGTMSGLSVTVLDLNQCPLILTFEGDTSNFFPSTIDGSAQPCADQTQAENGQMSRGGHSELKSVLVTACKVATHSSVKLSDT